MSEAIYIGLGSNLGDREHFLEEAILSLRRTPGVSVIRCSSLYDSAPIGPLQPRFLNAVAHLTCELSPQQLLKTLKQIEADLGRIQSGRWEARQIDLDILLWGRQVIADSTLQVPHLELHKRRFVLEPLCELAPDAEHSILTTKMIDLLRKLAPQDVVKVGPRRML